MSFSAEISTILAQSPQHSFAVELATNLAQAPTHSFALEISASLVQDFGHYFSHEIATELEQSPLHAFGPEIAAKFYFTSGSATSSPRDAVIELTNTSAASAQSNEKLDIIPAQSLSHLRDDLLSLHILGIRGPQVGATPNGVATTNLIDGVFSATEGGRAKTAANFVDAATAATKVAANAINSAVVATKIAPGAIPLSKLAAPTKERLAVTDKNKFVAAPTSGDNANTGLSVVGSPMSGGYVGVLVNGTLREVGNADMTKDCYFSGDGGATARAYGVVTTGDVLYWNGVIAAFNLLTTDRIDFLYVYSSF